MNPTITKRYLVIFRRGAERYCLVFDRGNLPQALSTLGRWANDPELSFTWRDMYRLSREIRRKVKG